MSDELAAFWREPHLGLLTTLRPDGTPHVVPVGVTVDDEFEVARVICSRGSVKARNVMAAGPGGAPVAVSQVDHADRRRWSTVEGRAVVRTDAAAVADAESRYTARYRRPRANPERVVIEIRINRRLGMR